MVQLYGTIPEGADGAAVYVMVLPGVATEVATLFITYTGKESEMSTLDISSLLSLEGYMMVYFFSLIFHIFL